MMKSTVIALSLVLAGPARGQTPVKGAGETIDPAKALETFSTVSDWLERWETPAEEPLPAGCVGVWVGIRLAGRPMGAGWSIDANNLEAPSKRALPGAVRQAMAAAYETAGGVADPDIRADKRQKFMDSPFRTLEIELAHSPKRIRGTSLDRVLESVRPGIDGLLLRRGQTSYAVFPGEMLAFDTRPSSAVVSLLSEAGAPIESIDTEIGGGVIRIWTFETTHIAQAVRQGAPTFLFRGSRPVPLESIDVAEIRTMANELAGYLLRSTVSPPDEPQYRLLLGDYAPHADRRLQQNASLAEHALAALALLKFSAVADAGEAASARSAAIGLLNVLAHDEGMRLSAGQNARVAALVQLAMKALKPDERTESLAELEKTTREGIERSLVNGQYGADLSPEDRALVAAALGTREALTAAWMSVGVELQPLLMPWICMGELSVAADGGPIPSIEAMKQLRERVLALQRGRDATQAAEPDLIGALNYRPRSEPDWRAAHLAAFCALMLGDGRCTNATERPAQILNLQRSMRFLRQLQVREVDRYRLRNPDYAMGGERAALCDQTMPTAATAMALLATANTLDAFDRLSAAGQ